MIMQNERGQNTHGQGERVKIPLLPYNVDKKSVKDQGPTVGSQQTEWFLEIHSSTFCYNNLNLKFFGQNTYEMNHVCFKNYDELKLFDKTKENSLVVNKFMIKYYLFNIKRHSFLGQPKND